MRKRLILFAALTILNRSAAAQEGDRNLGNFRPPAPILGTIGLQDGQQLRYAYHFDHNALTDCVRVGSSLIALTDSGNLIRFDAQTLEITGQRTGPGRATAITNGSHGKLLVGFEGGRIAEVDPVTLDLKTLFEAQGSVEWLRSRPGRDNDQPMIVAVVPQQPNVFLRPGETDASIEHRREKADRERRVFILVYGNGKPKHFDITVKGARAYEYSTFYLDDSGRLWMGVDGGEFGGRCAYISLKDGKIRMSTPSGDVLGFLHASDGRQLAYGGVSHLGGESGWIARVDQGTMVYLCSFDNDSSRGGQPVVKPPAGLENAPNAPVDLINEDSDAKGFWVVSAHTLYHASADFSIWAKVVELGGRWYGGRNLSVGNTPTVNAMIADGSEGFIFAMGRDGFLRVSGEKVGRNAIAGQLEVHSLDSVVDVWATSLGTILLAGGDEHSAWKLASDGWRKLSFTPQRVPKDQGIGCHHWGSVEPLLDDGGILALAISNCGTPECVLVKRTADGLAELQNWDSGECPGGYLPEQGVFATVGKSILQVSKNELKALEGSDWRRVGNRTGPSDEWRIPTPRGRRYIMLEATERADILNDVALGELLELTRKPDSTFQLQPIEYHGALKDPGSIFDAVTEDNGSVLLSAVEGLFRFHPEDGMLERIHSPDPSEEFRSICRDSQGRLWAAGSKLYISSDSAKHWESVPLPMLSPGFSRRIRPDPENQRRVIFSMDDQGIVFLEW